MICLKLVVAAALRYGACCHSVFCLESKGKADFFLVVALNA